MATIPNLGDLVKAVAENDAQVLVTKDASYEGSWKNDGGVGAYYTLKRPLDRFLAIAKRNGYDIFKVWEEEKAQGIVGHDGTFSAALQDLRRYLFLVETEMIHRTTDYPTSPAAPTTPTTADHPVSPTT